MRQPVIRAHYFRFDQRHHDKAAAKSNCAHAQKDCRQRQQQGKLRHDRHANQKYGRSQGSLRFNLALIFFVIFRLLHDPHAFVRQRSREIAATEERLLFKLNQTGASPGRQPANASPAMPTSFGKRVDVDSNQTRREDHFDNRSAQERDGQC